MPRLAVLMRGSDCKTWGCSTAHGDFGHIAQKGPTLLNRPTSQRSLIGIILATSLISQWIKINKGTQDVKRAVNVLSTSEGAN